METRIVNRDPETEIYFSSFRYKKRNFFFLLPHLSYESTSEEIDPILQSMIFCVALCYIAYMMILSKILPKKLGIRKGNILYSTQYLYLLIWLIYLSSIIEDSIFHSKNHNCGFELKSPNVWSRTYNL